MEHLNQALGIRICPICQAYPDLAVQVGAGGFVSVRLGCDNHLSGSKFVRVDKDVEQASEAAIAAWNAYAAQVEAERRRGIAP